MSTRIESGYSARLKDELLEEVEARKNEGSPNFNDISPEAAKSDLVAALNLDDEHKAVRATEDSTDGLPDVPESDLPSGELVEELPPASAYKGQYRKKSDNLIYALAIVSDTIRGRDYKARNKKWFWEGAKTEFDDQFVKE